MSPSEIDHRVDKEHHYLPGGWKYVNKIGLSGTVKWKPRLKYRRSGMPYTANLLDFSETITKLDAEVRNHFNECEFELHGDRAIIFAKKIIKHDRVLIFGSLSNATDMGGYTIMFVMADSFQWLGNMAKYMASNNELAERRNDHYRILEQLSEEEREDRE